MNIRRGDTVQVVSGNDKGKRGTVLSVTKDKKRVVVEGVRMMMHHTKPSSQEQQGGILEREAPIHVSNLMVMCPKTDVPTRIRHKKMDDGKFVRVSVRSSEMIDSQ